MASTAPCGLGGPTTVSGPCSSTLMPSDAGKGVFSSVDPASVVPGLLFAGAIMAGLIFAAWATMKVASFFNGRGEKGDLLGGFASDDAFWSARGDAANRHGADVEAARDFDVWVYYDYYEFEAENELEFNDDGDYDDVGRTGYDDDNGEPRRLEYDDGESGDLERLGHDA